MIPVVLVAIVVASICIMGTTLGFTRGSWRLRFPRVALAVWAIGFCFGALSLIGALILAVTEAAGVWGAPTGPEGVLATLMGWGALISLSALVVVASVGSEELSESLLSNQSAVLKAKHRRALIDGHEVIVTEVDEPIACTLPGRGARIVLSRGIIATLEPAQLRAVVAHEHAHLRQRHHLALRLAELHRTCLPGIPAASRLHRATSLLIELAADDDAARRHGAANLANALVAIGDRTGQPILQLRAARLAQRTWRRGAGIGAQATAPFGAALYAV